MLPGFRFLFAAIVLSMSMLVFGLGAAALLRAAHEQFASTPAWRAAPEATFAQQADVTRPVLAMLRIEPEPSPSDAAAAINAAASAEPAEAERIAAWKPQQPENARPDLAPNSRQQADAAAMPTEAIDTAPAGTTIASTEQVSPPASDVVPVASGSAAEPDHAAAATVVDAASTRIATLDGPPVAIEPPPPVRAAVGAKPDREAIRKQRQARRAAHRRRLAARARAAARLAAQQTVSPFSQPSAQSQPYAQSQLYVQPPAAHSR